MKRADRGWTSRAPMKERNAMTAIANTPRLPAVPRRARSAVLWFAAGTLLGATVATVTDLDDGSSRSRIEPAAVTAPTVESGVTISAQAAERWALADLEHRRLSCASTQHSPDAIERCVATI
jgi:hypothetical protein